MQARILSAPERFASVPRKRRVANILLADGDLASRLTVKTLLTTAGYAVETAASSAEATEKLDNGEFQLVLADLRAESDGAGQHLLAYARQKDFRPAAALLASHMSGLELDSDVVDSGERVVQVSNENVSWLLHHVAELISHRADRRIRQALRKAG